jgi:hypothetical protein
VRLTVSEVLADAWRLYTRNSGRLIGIAVVVFGFLSAVQALLNTTGSRLLVAVSVGVTIVGAVWVQGALVLAVDDLRGGPAGLSIGEIFRRVEPRLWTLLGAGLLVGVGVVAGLLLFIIPGLILLTYWSLVMPAAMLEHRGVLGSITRSQQLVAGNFLRVFAIVAITIILSTIVSLMIVAILSPLPDFVDIYVSGVIANGITVPFVALAWTLTYMELRTIKG